MNCYTGTVCILTSAFLKQCKASFFIFITSLWVYSRCIWSLLCWTQKYYVFMDKEMFSSTTQNYDSWFWPGERVKFFTVAVRGQNLELCGHVWVIILSTHITARDRSMGLLLPGREGCWGLGMVFPNLVFSLRKTPQAALLPPPVRETRGRDYELRTIYSNKIKTNSNTNSINNKSVQRRWFTCRVFTKNLPMNNGGRVSPSSHTFSQPEDTAFFQEARISYSLSPVVSLPSSDRWYRITT